MKYQLSYQSVLYSRRDQQSTFTGSSKYRLVDGEILEKKNPKKQLTIKGYSKTNEEDEKKSKEARIYKLNKSKVRKKCHALCRLEKSKKFSAFYSISFPCGLSDEVAYRIFNTWLTRCRKKSNLQTYLWVAERQTNWTIHFHLLTNDFMPIREVNSYMASCLLTEKNKGLDVLKTAKIEMYNGVDVKRVDKNRASLVSYLTKYITKNNIEFHRLPWHCSRDVSRLFTTINFDDPDCDKYFDLLPLVQKLDRVEDKYRIIKTKNFNVAGFKFRPDDKLYNDLDSMNEYVYKSQN
jgi:hypothetical protein